MGVSPISTVAAIGTSLFLETSGFGTAVYRYWRRRLADMRTVRTLAAATVPLGILGAVIAHHAPTNLLRVVYGVAMLGVALLLYTGESSGRRPKLYKCPCIVCESECSYGDCPSERRRKIETADGEVLQYCIEGMREQIVLFWDRCFSRRPDFHGCGGGHAANLGPTFPVSSSSGRSNFNFGCCRNRRWGRHYSLCATRDARRDVCHTMELDRVGRAWSNYRRNHGHTLSGQDKREGFAYILLGLVLFHWDHLLGGLYGVQAPLQ